MPGDAVLELEHLHGDRALEAVDARDAVTDLEHGADLGEVGLDVEVLDALLEDRGDLFRAKFHCESAPCGQFLTEGGEPTADARVRAQRAGLEHDAADRSGSTLREASTLRPEACSMRPTISFASSSESSYAVVSVTVELPFGARNHLVELGADAFERAGASLLAPRASGSST